MGINTGLSWYECQWMGCCKPWHMVKNCNIKQVWTISQWSKNPDYVVKKLWDSSTFLWPPPPSYETLSHIWKCRWFWTAPLTKWKKKKEFRPTDPIISLHLRKRKQTIFSTRPYGLRNCSHSKENSIYTYTACTLSFILVYLPFWIKEKADNVLWKTRKT